MSGRSNGGNPGSANDAAPRPVSASSPTKTNVPIPAASRPGRSTSPSVAPPSPEASISRKAPRSGDPSRALIAAKLPAAATTAPTCCGHVTAGEAHRTDREARAEGDQRGLRTQHHTQAQGRERREHHAGELDRCRRPTGDEPVGRRVAASTGEMADRQADQHTGEPQHRQRPPQRGRGEAQRPREADEDPLLHRVDELQEEVRGRRDRHPDDRREEQEAHVGRGPELRRGVRGWRYRGRLLCRSGCPTGRRCGVGIGHRESSSSSLGPRARRSDRVSRGRDAPTPPRTPASGARR